MEWKDWCELLGYRDVQARLLWELQSYAFHVCIN